MRAPWALVLLLVAAAAAADPAAGLVPRQHAVVAAALPAAATVPRPADRTAGDVSGDAVVPPAANPSDEHTGTMVESDVTDGGFRIEHDTMGEVRVPVDALWRAQTQRAV
ncbi:MAG: fumarate hydratase, class, partial [Pseudonocardiales bacterium]|nr:fumarate hydratase, class [Pseudonocardiales bacterium]